MEIIETITAIVSLVVAIATSVIAILTKLKAIKNVNAAKTANDHLISLQHISDKIREFAIIAEANGGTGEEKKQFVLNSIKAISEEYGWTYDEQWVSYTLEVIIDLSKKINKGDK
jgi:hypothetical protein